MEKYSKGKNINTTKRVMSFTDQFILLGLIFKRAILTAAVRVMGQPRGRLPDGQGFAQRLESQLLVQPIADRPAHQGFSSNRPVGLAAGLARQVPHPRRHGAGAVVHRHALSVLAGGQARSGRGAAL